MSSSSSASGSDRASSEDEGGESGSTGIPLHVESEDLSDRFEAEEEEDDLVVDSEEEEDEEEFDEGESLLLPAAAAVASSSSSGGKSKTALKKKIMKKKTLKKPGIIYLSSIPSGFNVSRTTAYFSELGQVGRVFLQPNIRDKSKYRSFTEGWIEFTSKSVARQVAENLNCTQVGGKKRSRSSELLWNVKYLPRFKWSHLTERANYERAVHSQRLRTEVSQAKREGDFFKAGLAKRSRKSAPAQASETHQEFFLKETASARRKRTASAPGASSQASKRPKRESAKGKKTLKRSEFLKNVFSGPE
eukprot:TRINITY_DN6418_c0_g1_i1.p1 TRINITY_DN6418_c0_g1~~TRINITY_DN6418_c0_g1_i1.p1  ORF type:complete len:304 (-),score=140.43 TRINITY_DN6418_c0_g1_i1:249-1160(-)